MTNTQPPRKKTQGGSKSGIFPRITIETDARREPPMHSALLDELNNIDQSSNTGSFPAVKEGRDTTAIGDDDHINQD